ncbi:PREDICTED: histone H1oo [Ceratotherium simum simum]|uniref:Histone H1oo n=1 Tax=Ceratotherium simum simum TaxID=73337 RepID=A0ABM0I8B1_CERSS|nr:PREDICTED: histone H1oo [Ceratotherium simum simum]
MAPGSIASSDSSTSSSSTTSMAGLPGSSGTEKPGTSRGGVPAPRRHPPVLRMVLEALQAGERRRGTSVAAIKVYILQKYPTVDLIRLKYLLKQALATGMRRGLLVRPLNSKAKGATGSFKLVPKHKRKIQPRKTSAMTARRRPGEAEVKGPKKPSEAKKDPPNAGEMKKRPRRAGDVRTAPSKPGAAEEKAPKKGSQTQDQEARLGEARKAPRQPDKARRAPPSARGPGGKSKVKGRSSQGRYAEAHRETKDGSQSSKPTVTKGERGAACPARKKMENKVPKEAAAHGARAGPRARPTAPPKGSASKTMPAPLAGEMEAHKDPRRRCMPTKASSSKAASKKTEPRARGVLGRDRDSA